MRRGVGERIRKDWDKASYRFFTCVHASLYLNLVSQGGSIEEEPVFFDLSPRQKEYQLMVTTLNNRLKSEYHALHKFLWKSGVRAAGHNMPPREDIPDRKPDACRCEPDACWCEAICSKC